MNLITLDARTKRRKRTEMAVVNDSHIMLVESMQVGTVDHDEYHGLNAQITFGNQATLMVTQTVEQILAQCNGRRLRTEAFENDEDDAPRHPIAVFSEFILMLQDDEHYRPDRSNILLYDRSGIVVPMSLSQLQISVGSMFSTESPDGRDFF